MRVFLEKTIYNLLQLHFPRNLILDSESSVNFTSEMPTLKFLQLFFLENTIVEKSNEKTSIQDLMG